MIYDFNKKNFSRDLSTDICVVGAGAAGISIALEFLNSKQNIILLESGGESLTQKNESLNNADTVGATYKSLDNQRARFFGGTTNLWGGNCIPLDSIDFEEVGARKERCWPFRKKNIEDYILRAQVLLGIPEKFGNELLKKININTKADFKNRFEWRVWQFCEYPFKFGKIFYNKFKNSENISLYLNANLVDFDPYNKKNKIKNAVVKSLNGRKIKVYAKKFVIATGGIENSRILLNIKKKFNKLNQNELIGKYFSEHPNATIGYLYGNYAYEIFEKHRACYLPNGTFVKPGLKVSEKLQQENSSLNGIISLWPIPIANTNIKRIKLILELLQKKELNFLLIKNIFLLLLNPFSIFPHILFRLTNGLVKIPYKKNVYEVRLMTETLPNINSRVKLNSKTDSLGMRQVDVDWQLSKNDRFSFFLIANKAKEYFEENEGVKLELTSWIKNKSQDWSKFINLDGHFGHHMGTTFMSYKNIRGVVDENCKVEDIDNLYVAGSSVFPTYGYANPTLMIISLAIKLADHLKRSL